MIVYHGSTEIVKNPDVKHSYRSLDFVCRCRDGEKDYQKYDLIFGKVANDKVFRVVDMYHTGI